LTDICDVSRGLFFEANGMWRRRKEPMTTAQVARYHRARFAIGFFTFLWLLVATLLALHYAATLFEYGVALAIGTMAVYFWQVARRRWRRMQEVSWWERAMLLEPFGSGHDRRCD
jgi:hypothetical protein